MKIELESTVEIAWVNGVPTRLWVGKTESGIAVHAFVVLIGVRRDEDNAQFERELLGRTNILFEQLEAATTREKLQAVLDPLGREHAAHKTLVVGCPFCEGAIT
jgi:hypothetical protein